MTSAGTRAEPSLTTHASKPLDTRRDKHIANAQGDRSPGFFNGPSRCCARVYDHNLQSTHCAETTSAD